MQDKNETKRKKTMRRDLICNLLNPNQDQYPISSHSNTALSVITIMRIKEMIVTLRSCDCHTKGDIRREFDFSSR